MTILAISDGQLRVGDVVNIGTGLPPYTLMRVDADMYFFVSDSGDEYTTDAGYVYIIGRNQPIINYQNGNGTIHATINGRPICGHLFTVSHWQTEQAVTCEHCKGVLR